MKRRTFLKKIYTAVGWTFLATGQLAWIVRSGWAQIRKRILPADTDLNMLVNENPSRLDTRNLPITPIGRFETMGLSDHKVDLERWRLTIGGNVARPLELSYPQVQAMPTLERDLLLICPGFFAYHARWSGVSIWGLLQKAGIDAKAAYVDVKGPAGRYQKVQRFSLEDARTDRAFLALAVNGQPLPEKHGFPLRAVAEGYYGADWVKYVSVVEAVVI